MSLSHPIRKDWENVFENLKFSSATYVNGGFIGLPAKHFHFLDSWIAVQNKIESHIGNLNNWNISDRTYIFQKTDQDALNISMHIKNNFENCSLIGKEAMDFIEGGYIMSHALAQPKPWNKKFIRRSLAGIRPTKSDKLYHEFLSKPLQLKTKRFIKFKKLSIKVAVFITLFVRRS